MNILIIEDDILLANNIKNIFEKIVITNRIKIINSYEEFLMELCNIKYYNVLLTDIKLWNDFSDTWIDIIKTIRTKKINIPIIVISCLWEIYWLEKAFDIWANDYLIKPFRLKELQIRVIRWFKIYYTTLNLWENNKKTYKELEYDLNSNEFYYKWYLISLSRKLKYILSLFLSEPEKLIFEIDLVEMIRWEEYLFSKKNVRINILRLKNTLKPFWIDNWIYNVRWEWYIMKDDLTINILENKIC